MNAILTHWRSLLMVIKMQQDNVNIELNLLINNFSIGLELETNIISTVTGQAITDFNNTTTYTGLEKHLIAHGFLPPQTEFDAATVEFTTPPCNTIQSSFQILQQTLNCAQ